MLLRMGANIDATDSNQQSALMHACRLGEPKMIACLLAENANPHLVDNRDCDALMYACQGGSDQNQRLASINLLLQAGATPSTVDLEHRTALHHAIMPGNESIVLRLLESGANPDPSDIEGITPLTLAAASGFLDDRKGRPTTRKLDETAAIIDVLLSAGADPGHKSSMGEPIVLAQSYRCPAIVRSMRSALNR